MIFLYNEQKIELCSDENEEDDEKERAEEIPELIEKAILNAFSIVKNGFRQ